MSVILFAPIDGWCSALEEVPDPVFSGKLVGDGLAIDPTSATLYAPCAGNVVALQAAKHAVTLRASNGAEILLHVGVDTVAFGGEGFEAHVVQGQDVRVGDPLLTFDLDGLAPRVRSLITPVIIINGGGFAVVRREQQRTVRVGDFLMEVGAAGEAEVQTGPASASRRFTVPFEHGFHVRPAAQIAGYVRIFFGHVGLFADIRFVIVKRESGLGH